MLSWADRVSLTGVDRAHFKANKKADVDARARFAILAQARVGPPPLFASVQAPLLLDKKTTSRLARVYLLSSHPRTILPCKSNGHPPCHPGLLEGSRLTADLCGWVLIRPLAPSWSDFIQRVVCFWFCSGELFKMPSVVRRSKSVYRSLKPMGPPSVQQGLLFNHSSPHL